ncbi:MAG: beta-ketoacyl-ACP synthase II [Phycisphaerales bacterium]|nr:beta-ketoacyl-ACP synthase II [Planctomycetota bacterium]MBL6997366.1 beta-ketoacyl-ACP synthase II [Phycisphaerales bacterium]
MSVHNQRRVVITGLGAISNLGHDVTSTWSGMVEGRSGIGPITAFEQDDRWSATIAGEVRDWDPTTKLDRSEIKKMDRFSQLGLWAAIEAMENCGLDWNQGDPYRNGVVIGSGVGGIQTIEFYAGVLKEKGPRRLSPFTVPKLMVNATAGNVSIKFNLRGVNSAPATACATGGHALAEAFMFIASDQADFILAGGAEGAVSPVCVSSFSAMKALSTRNDEPTLASRPFDRDRDGFVLAEGAAVLAVEELEHAKARGATILAEIIGFGITGDAGHIAAPDAVGTGAHAAMKTALRHAKLEIDQVDYINAHGTSTPLGDIAEVSAVKSLFGNHASSLAMSSTKSCTGHMLGAAGGIESIAVVKAIYDGVMPPTINLDNPDEGFDLNFVANTAQERTIKVALNNSFGFGGHNVSLAIAAFNG